MTGLAFRGGMFGGRMVVMEGDEVKPIELDTIGLEATDLRTGRRKKLIQDGRLTEGGIAEVNKGIERP